MPEGPKGEHFPVDVIGAAIKVMRIWSMEDVVALIDAPAELEAVRSLQAARSEGWGYSKLRYYRQAATAVSWLVIVPRNGLNPSGPRLVSGPQR